jgi:hypothetical protein
LPIDAIVKKKTANFMLTHITSKRQALIASGYKLEAIFIAQKTCFYCLVLCTHAQLTLKNPDLIFEKCKILTNKIFSF